MTTYKQLINDFLLGHQYEQISVIFRTASPNSKCCSCHLAGKWTVRRRVPCGWSATGKQRGSFGKGHYFSHFGNV